MIEYPVEVAQGIGLELRELRAEIERLRAALEPFVRAAGFHCIEVQADDSLQVLVKVAPGLSGALTVKDFRRARKAYQQKQDDAVEWHTIARGAIAEIERLRAALRGLLTAATAPATCDDDWEAEIQEAERVLGVHQQKQDT
jgi:hypothetical protein